MKITTNNKWREIDYNYDELEPGTENEPQAGFYYQKEWFSLSDFIKIINSDDLKGWHGIQHFTYGSGMLVKLSDCGESIIVGRF